MPALTYVTRETCIKHMSLVRRRVIARASEVTVNVGRIDPSGSQQRPYLIIFTLRGTWRTSVRADPAARGLTALGLQHDGLGLGPGLGGHEEEGEQVWGAGGEEGASPEMPAGAPHSDQDVRFHSPISYVVHVRGVCILSLRGDTHTHTYVCQHA